MMCLGDPRLKGMNDTQWVFELEAMNLQDKERYDELRLLSDITKKQIISMLGLNLLPVEDEKTGLLRQPEENECLPLAIMLGRDDILSAIKDRQEQYHTQETVRAQLEESDAIRGPSERVDTGAVELTPEELEEFMKDDGDVEFENAPEDLLKAMKWGGRDAQMLLENLVLSKDDLGDDPLKDLPARTLGKARSDIKDSLKKRPVVSSLEVEEVELRSTKGSEVKSDRPVVTLDIE
jgi:hypothetical protein